jgi:outer membrane protein, multidrug efflux system
VDTWNAGGTIRLPIFDFGRVRALVKQADARQQAALATFEQTVKSAIADVETSLVGYAKAQQQARSLRTAARANREAEELSRMHYQEGISSLIDVLLAQQRRLEAESNLASAEAAVGQRYAALYKALGGGALVSQTTLQTPPPVRKEMPQS